MKKLVLKYRCIVIVIKFFNLIMYLDRTLDVYITYHPHCYAGMEKLICRQWALLWTQGNMGAWPLFYWPL